MLEVFMEREACGISSYGWKIMDWRIKLSMDDKI